MIHFLLLEGTTDYMDRFIDEQDASRDRSSSPTAYHSLIFGADSKKGLPIVFVKNRFVESKLLITALELNPGKLGS